MRGPRLPAPGSSVADPRKRGRLRLSVCHTRVRLRLSVWRAPVRAACDALAALRLRPPCGLRSARTVSRACAQRERVSGATLSANGLRGIWSVRPERRPKAGVEGQRTRIVNARQRFDSAAARATLSANGFPGLRSARTGFRSHAQRERVPGATPSARVRRLRPGRKVDRTCIPRAFVRWCLP